MKSRQKLNPEKVKRELLPEQSLPLLKKLHLLTADGHLNADARRKLKQVNHLVNLIKPALEDVLSRHSDVTVVDVGAGKAYLGFILYDLFFKNLEAGKVVSIESREELARQALQTAKELGYPRMEFVSAKMGEKHLPERVHLLTALHACDTATDDAIIAGIKASVDYMALVPCCQAEVAEQLRKVRAEKWEDLWSHGIHRREFGSHLTNVLRCLLLESFGYQVTVTELVGWEHSLKNEFIFAKRVNRENKEAKSKLEKLLATVSVRPKAVRVLLDEA